MRECNVTRRHRRAGLRRQKGQVALITVLLICVVLGISLYSVIRPKNVVLEDAAQTELALSQARDALISYAAGRLSTNRPGELPCPDTTNDGVAEANCNTAASRLGRLPWSTLGIPDLRDGSGERLWYAVSNNFKNATAVTPLNSNTPGQLTVTGLATASNVIAVVFAPGPVVGAQIRSAGNVNNVTHYLEGENANGDTIYIAAAASGTFNDRLLAITPAMFFPPVEMRVAREVRVFLNAYFNSPIASPLRYFPFAHAYGPAEPPCVASTQGRIPQLPVIPGPPPKKGPPPKGPPAPPTCGASPPVGAALPPWFEPNAWRDVLFYAVAPACTNSAAPNCTGAGGFLTVNGVGGIRAIIITPGTAYTGQARPCTVIADCLEAPNTTSFPVFTHNPGSATTNDRIVIISP